MRIRVRFINLFANIFFFFLSSNYEDANFLIENSSLLICSTYELSREFFIVFYVPFVRRFRRGCRRRCHSGDSYTVKRWKLSFSRDGEHTVIAGVLVISPAIWMFFLFRTFFVVPSTMGRYWLYRTVLVCSTAQYCSTSTFYTDMENTNPLNTSTSSDDVISTTMQKWMATTQHNWHQKCRGFPIPFVQSSWLVNLLHECPCCHRTMTSLGRRNTGIASSSREEVSSSSGTELTSRCRYVPTKLIRMEMRRTFSAIAQSSR